MRARILVFSALFALVAALVETDVVSPSAVARSRARQSDDDYSYERARRHRVVVPGRRRPSQRRPRPGEEVSPISEERLERMKHKVRRGKIRSRPANAPERRASSRGFLGLGGLRAQTTAGERVLSARPGMSRNQGISLLGRSQSGAPADTQLAAGPDVLVQMVNSNGSVWTKQGGLITAFDLNSFFHIPVSAGYYFSDPQVLYDQGSGRWFAAGIGVNPKEGSKLYLAVSRTPDPTQPWAIYTLASDTSGIVYDQPKLGGSDDKIIITTNDANMLTGTFVGEEEWVVEKADLVAGAEAPRIANRKPVTNAFSVVPAHSQSSTKTAYMAWNASALNNTGSPFTSIVRVTGTPAQGNVTRSETYLRMQPTTVPPEARQAGGEVVDTGDDRYQSVVWRDGILWVAGNSACQPADDTQARACLKLVQVSTASGTLSLVQDLLSGRTGFDFHFPAVTLDDSRNMVVAFSSSSAQNFIAAEVSGQAAGTTGAIEPAKVLAPGQGTYSGFDARLSVNRWGDYSGASPDPADPSRVWVAAQFAATASDPGNWGTSIGQITFAAQSSPTATPLNPEPTPSSPPEPVPSPTPTPSPSRAPTPTPAASTPPAANPINLDVTPPSITGLSDRPDPFYPNRGQETKITLTISESATVTVTIHNQRGAQIKKLPVKEVPRGTVSFTWGGRNENGAILRATYIYRVTAVDAAGNQKTVSGTTTVR